MRTRFVSIVLLASACGQVEPLDTVSESDSVEQAMHRNNGRRQDGGSPGGMDAGSADAECGLPVGLFEADWRNASSIHDVRTLQLDTVSRSLFLLLDQLDQGVVPPTFRSLEQLSPPEQRMTIAAALIRNTRPGSTPLDSRGPRRERHHDDDDHDGDDDDEHGDDNHDHGDGPPRSPPFVVNCIEVRRLAFGEPKSVLDVAQAVNVAAGEPRTAQEVASQPFTAHPLINEIARANDRGERLKRHAPRTQASTVISNPVRQLVVGFVGASRATDSRRHHVTRPWISVAQTQSGLDALLYELGDHVAPPAPVLAPLPAFIRTSPLTLSGTGERGTGLTVSGGSSPATTTVTTAGTFTVDVPLNLDAVNQLTAHLEDLAGNRGPSSSVTVTHDDVPPVLTIASPANGLTTNDETVVVAGAVQDNFQVGLVRVNGVAVSFGGGVFQTTIALLPGANIINVEAGDAAGNLAATDFTVVRGVPDAFGYIGALGGSLQVSTPGLLNGAYLFVPPGALTSMRGFSIRYASEASSLPSGVVAVGPPVAFEPGGTTFGVPVEIGVPFDRTLLPAVRTDESQVRLYALEAGQTQFQLVPSANLPSGGNTLIAEVNHFTIFQAGAVLPNVFVQTWAGNGTEGPLTPSPTAQPWTSAFPQAQLVSVDSAGLMAGVVTLDADGSNPQLFDIDLTTRVMRRRPYGLPQQANPPLNHPLGMVMLPGGEMLISDEVGSLVRVTYDGAVTPIAGPLVGNTVGTIRGMAIDLESNEVLLAVTGGVSPGPRIYSLAGNVLIPRWTPVELPTIDLPPPFTGARGPQAAGCTQQVSDVLAPFRMAVAPVGFQSGPKALFFVDPRRTSVHVLNVGVASATLFPNAGANTKNTCLSAPVTLQPGESTAIMALSERPTGLAVDSLGNVFVSDQNSHRILVMSAASGCVTELAVQAGACGYDGDGRAPTDTALAFPAGLAITPNDDLLFGDPGNVRLRIIYDNDRDGDGLPNGDGLQAPNLDNCPDLFNPDQAEGNGNNVGTVCDPTEDETPPLLTFEAPTDMSRAPGGFRFPPGPNVEVVLSYSDPFVVGGPPASGVALNTLTTTLNGATVSLQQVTHPDAAHTRGFLNLADGLYVLEATVADTNGNVSSTARVSFLVGNVPGILSIHPAQAVAGATVKVVGGGFTSIILSEGTTPTVRFGATTATLLMTTSTELYVRVPALALGNYNVVVHRGSFDSNPMPFTVVAADPSAPALAGASPPFAQPGTPIRLSGARFAVNADENVVTFGDAVASIAPWPTCGNSLMATVPDLLPGTYPIPEGSPHRRSLKRAA